jgi:hypothetical protein
MQVAPNTPAPGVTERTQWAEYRRFAFQIYALCYSHQGTDMKVRETLECVADYMKECVEGGMEDQWNGRCTMQHM